MPFISVSGDTVTVKVGSVTHPSLPAHYIEFIVLETSAGIHTKWLKPGDAPEAAFTLAEGEKALDEARISVFGLGTADDFMF